MLATASQLVLRNIDDLSGKVLLVEPLADNLATELQHLAPQLTLSCYSTDAAVAASWSQDKVTLYRDVSPVFSDSFDTVVLFYPKSKEQLAFTLAQLKPVLSATTAVFVTGDNKGGIKSLSSHAQKLGLNANKLDNAKHCLWFTLHGDFQQLPQAKAVSFNISAAGETLTLHSLPGVFNHGKLDVGTALLLDNLPEVNQGKVLDFACGCGVVGAMLKRKHPDIELFSSDISSLAVVSTQQTLAANNLSGTVIAADGLPAIPKQFDCIVSNPPFHTGIKTDYSIVDAFISQSAARLSSNGSLTIVANSHLSYLELLQQAFKKVTVKAKANGFVVYRATNQN
ncbi:methyltransferase [Rheinheimera sp. YQF-2]|jgi:16S rRNA (guanine1207-N2)-methyltransferase|uniref:Ribosomal RNA small subunit methyltransferase C n=1 Tax=Rheinheimera lutimaris TaxID=2740584 RepID=A0A7Y5EJ26_9GAMM|nr:methyltransferase [Rheinheimera lutimaris]NRQ44114.1 methyltransferase [Rheinheimera lutimaris]